MTGWKRAPKHGSGDPANPGWWTIRRWSEFMWYVHNVATGLEADGLPGMGWTFLPLPRPDAASSRDRKDDSRIART